MAAACQWPCASCDRLWAVSTKNGPGSQCGAAPTAPRSRQRSWPALQLPCLHTFAWRTGTHLLHLLDMYMYIHTCAMYTIGLITSFQDTSRDLCQSHIIYSLLQIHLHLSTLHYYPLTVPTAPWGQHHPLSSHCHYSMCTHETECCTCQSRPTVYIRNTPCIYLHNKHTFTHTHTVLPTRWVLCFTCREKTWGVVAWRISPIPTNYKYTSLLEYCR